MGESGRGEGRKGGERRKVNSSIKTIKKISLKINKNDKKRHKLKKKSIFSFSVIGIEIGNLYFFFFSFWDRVSCFLGCPGTIDVAKDDLNF